jgi:hypothetical protein
MSTHHYIQFRNHLCVVKLFKFISVSKLQHLSDVQLIFLHKSFNDRDFYKAEI